MTPSRQPAPKEETLSLFIVLIFLATLAPLLLFPLINGFHPDTSSLIGFLLIIDFFGTGHVGSTAFLYADPQMRSFFRENKIWYIYVPMVLIVGMGLAFQFLPQVWIAHLLLINLIWQTYHFQRQNYGILSFLAAATDTGRVTWIERTIIELGVVAGILGAFRVVGLQPGTFLESYIDLLYQSGVNIMIMIPVFVVFAVITIPALRKSWLRLSFLMIAGSFYLPTFLFTDVKAAILSYSYAHGFQYYVFMSLCISWLLVTGNTLTTAGFWC